MTKTDKIKFFLTQIVLFHEMAERFPEGSAEKIRAMQTIKALEFKLSRAE